MPDTLNIGLIGVGGRGFSHLEDLVARSKDMAQEVRLAAVCEIYEPRKERARRAAGLDKIHHDYGDLLAREDIDAVVIATPDHWHSRMSIDAMRAGKAVYCEKPMTHSWEEARDVARVQRETGRVFQVGVQSCDDDLFWQARRLIQAGALGKILHAQASANRNVPGGDWNYDMDLRAARAGLDWDRFLGPAPRIPFTDENIERFFRFRKYWDYSGGLATDLLYHCLGRHSIVMGFNFPRRVAALGGNYVHFDREVPDTFQIAATMEGDYTLSLSATARNDRQVPERFRGEKATITIHKIPGEKKATHLTADLQGPHKKGAAEWSAIAAGWPNAKTENGGATIRLEREPRPNHMSNFLAAVRAGKPEDCYMGAEQGYRAMVTIALAVKSFRESRAYRFNAAEQKAEGMATEPLAGPAAPGWVS